MRQLPLLLAILTLGTAATCSGADKAHDSELGDDSRADDSSADDSSADDSRADDSSADDSADDSAPTAEHALLNELLAGNEAGITDEAGQNEDWLELYNPSGATLDLTGWSLTDDLGVDEPWPLPEGTTVPPYGYLLIWCDEDPEDGPLHAAFKLSGDGETVSLLDPEGQVVDEVSYPPQTDDISWGRLPDGGGAWGSIDPPTPNRANPAAR